MKALSAIIAIIMLLMITVALAGSAYVWIVGTTTSLTSTGTQAVTQTTTGMLAQMKVESAAGNKVYIRNTGKGTIENASLSVYMDDLRLGHSLSPLSLAEGQVGELTLSGLWQLSLGKHTLKITTASLQLQQAVEAVPHSSAVGAWKLDEGSGTTASDSSGFGNSGTLFNGPLWVAGKFGSALQFDGVNDYVNVLNSASLRDTLTGITVEAWVNPVAYTGHASDQWYVVSKLSYPSSGWWFRLTNGGRVAFSTLDGTYHTAVTTDTVPLSQWSHIVGWSNGMTNKVFINGVEKASAASGTLTASNANFQIAVSSTDYTFNGIIDNVMIFNKALTPDETVSLKLV